MELNEIKKALYKENPNAILKSVRKGMCYYSAHIPSVDKIIQFEVPCQDMGDATFLSNMDSKLLIRWIVLRRSKEMNQKFNITIEKLSYSQIVFPVDCSKMFLTKNFAKRSSDDVIGLVNRIYREDDEVKAEVEFFDNKFVDGVPAITYEVIEEDEEDIPTKIKITQVTLCDGNCDDSIKKISEQLAFLK